MSDLAEKQTVRKIYSQIIAGYSTAFYKESEIYIKHFSDNEFSSFDEEFEIIYKSALNQGILPEKEKLEDLLKGGHWSEEENMAIEDLENSIQDSYKQRTKTPSAQWPGIDHFIGILKSKKYALEKSRNELMGITAEDYAQRKNNEKIIFNSLFKDESLKTPYFEDAEFKFLHQEELGECIKVYNTNMENFTEPWVKKVAILPSFLNSFFLCNDDPRIFYGKAVVELTIYQTDLFSKAKYYKSILNESEHNGPPQETYNEGFQAVVNWYDLQYSVISAKRTQERAQANAQQRSKRSMTGYS